MFLFEYTNDSAHCGRCGVHVEMVKLLVEHKADVDTKQNGETALTVAVLGVMWRWSSC